MTLQQCYIQIMNIYSVNKSASLSELLAHSRLKTDLAPFYIQALSTVNKIHPLQLIQFNLTYFLSICTKISLSRPQMLPSLFFDYIFPFTTK